MTEEGCNLVGKRDLNKRAYTFFAQAEKEQRHLDVTAIASETGYERSTVRIYIARKWRAFLFPLGDGNYEVRGVRGRSYEEFQALQHEQILVIPCPAQTLIWLQRQAISKNCSVQEIVLEALERQMQSQEAENR
jgi:hypothetical protein